ncbi:hypothetical protein [Streptomyces sp. XD-27]|uniref:hypothetical protein n=1 Tax=Streptomyces sp. XD-27 TaxID=3062779 RepID=UPI0026F43571|nr:hypothetical protein [Streptomyces sp. XD-27]WKX73833.1 hypothetical protein Q3Y56_31710 [Streptomyces sp. XD-27]
MAHLVYIDETGSVGKGANKQKLLTLAAVLVHEDKVQPLAEKFCQVARKHLQRVPADFELHGNEIWNGTGPWDSLLPAGLFAVYEDAIAVINDLDIDVSHASIHKERLHTRYGGDADGNAYLLALQFLLAAGTSSPGGRPFQSSACQEPGCSGSSKKTWRQSRGSRWIAHLPACRPPRPERRPR